jgi:hypothetical protein
LVNLCWQTFGIDALQIGLKRFKNYLYLSLIDNNGHTPAEVIHSPTVIGLPEACINGFSSSGAITCGMTVLTVSTNFLLGMSEN